MSFIRKKSDLKIVLLGKRSKRIKIPPSQITKSTFTT